ncbi:MAG: 1-acyl-sn-glycerol-3-phosphate acyltransferase [Acidobacteriota bacterium]|nr:1-acyl-sn-glycerol-3-phosphate acyltransferase [Acidobacteriota bacterium]
MFYSVTRLGFRMLAGVLFRLRVRDDVRLPSQGAAIVVAEHRSWLDPPCVGAACRRPVRFLVMEKVYRKPWACWFYRRMGSIPVGVGRRRAALSLREALRRLHSGEVVGVFPEGRVVPDGESVDYRDGAALLSVRSGAPVVPIGIGGTARAWPRGKRCPRPAPVAIRFGEPLQPPAPDSENAVSTFSARIEENLRILSTEERARVERR